MVNRPASLDTLVATNLHADILSDLAAALAGSLGIAPTGNIDPERRYPSMFEPIHGSAFDIMGQGLANPIGTFWSVVMLLEHLGERDAAARLMGAIESVTADPALHTRDLGGDGDDGAGDRRRVRPARRLRKPPGRLRRRVAPMRPGLRSRRPTRTASSSRPHASARSPPRWLRSSTAGGMFGTTTRRPGVPEHRFRPDVLACLARMARPAALADLRRYLADPGPLTACCLDPTCDVMSLQDPLRTTAPPDFLRDGGEMGALMRGHDWAGSSLGAPDRLAAVAAHGRCA